MIVEPSLLSAQQGSGWASATPRSSPPAPRGSERLAEAPLFTGIAADELERLEHFMAPFEARPCEVLFRQGEDGDRVYVIRSGSVEVQAELTGGAVDTLATLGAGALLGEMSLLGGARRSGTALVREPTTGWMLHRSALAMLRMDAAPGAVELVARMTELVLARLRARYEAIAQELAQADPEAAARIARHEPAAAASELVAPEYLASLLCFRHFHDHAQIAAALGGAGAVELPAGAVALAAGAAPTEVLLVLRGALDVSLRRAHIARRVRLAGPGRLVGYVGALDGAPSPVTAHAREPVVLLALPARRVGEMLRDPSAAARRFSAGLAEDVARALRQAERPIARVASGAPGARR